MKHEFTPLITNNLQFVNYGLSITVYQLRSVDYGLSITVCQIEGESEIYNFFIPP
jgi:hypothetical protein